MSVFAADTPLRMHGNLSLLEMAPLLLAREAFYPGPTELRHGGVLNLWGETADLASLAADGECELAANSETQALRCAREHPDLRFVFTLAICPYRIVARRSAGIARLEDLRGRRIGVMRHSSSQYFLDRMLRTVGLTDEDATLEHFMAKTERPLTLMPEALRDGELDAVTVWEPQMQRARRALGDGAVEFSDPSVYRELFCLCSTASKLADPQLRPRIVAFVRALIAATAELKRDPARGQTLVARHAGTDLAIVRDAWPYLDYPGTLVADTAEVLVPADAWVARESGGAGRPLATLAQQVDASIVREALGA